MTLPAATPAPAHRRRVRRHLAVAGALLGTIAAIMPSSRADAAGVRYAALGDSYSAGVGTYDSQNSCYQSPKGYAPLAASAQGWSLDYRACSGATTPQVQTQTSGLAADTTLITLTTGGNDAGFSTVITQCALPGWLGDCTSALTSASSMINGDLSSRLAALYGAMHQAAPGARVVQLGYPRLFNGRNCSWLTFFTASEMASLNQMADDLATVEARAAAVSGVQFVDARAAFADHAVCSSTPWINNLTVPTTDSFHPNSAGQVGYENLFLTAIGVPNKVAAPRQTAGVAAGDTSVAVKIPASTLLATAARMPHVSSGPYLARARRHGVSSATMRRIDADLHSGDAARVRRAFQALHQLDGR